MANSRSEQYLNAMKDVTENSMSVREAARKWGVPKSSLYDRLSGKVEYYRRSGPPTVLTKHEEGRIADWLLEMEQRCCLFSKNDIFDHVKKMLDNDDRETPFIDNRPGNKWLRSFLSRHDNIHIKTITKREKKVNKTSTSALNEWYSAYKQFIQGQGHDDTPSQIWKCSVIHFELIGSHGKIGDIVEKTYKDLSDSKEHLTLLTCFNAIGQWIPPYIIIPGKRMPKTYNPLENGFPGCAFTVTEKGNMDSSTFQLWLEDHFVPSISIARPVVLLVDNSHVIDPVAFELANKNCIEIFGISSNVGENVEVAFSHVLKQSWYKNVKMFNECNPNTDITKKNFCAVFRSTWEDIMQPRVLIDSFNQLGLYPVNRLHISENHHDNQVAASQAPYPSSFMTLTTCNVETVVEIDTTSEAMTSSE